MPRRMAMKIWIVLFVLVSGCQSIQNQVVGGVASFDALALIERGEALVIDVRSAAETRSGGPIGAIRIQFGPDDFLSRPASAEERESFTNKIRATNAWGKKIFLLCQYGVRSDEAQKTLAEQGISSVSIAGGWLGRGHLVGLRDWLQ